MKMKIRVDIKLECYSYQMEDFRLGHKLKFQVDK